MNSSIGNATMRLEATIREEGGSTRRALAYSLKTSITVGGLLDADASVCYSYGGDAPILVGECVDRVISHPLAGCRWIVIHYPFATLSYSILLYPTPASRAKH